MTDARTVTYTSPPAAALYMWRALRPRRRAPLRLPDTHLEWRGYAVPSQLLQALRDELAPALAPSPRALALLAPQITGFRLAMAALTRSDWPLSIWGALQVRNRLCLLHDIEPDAPGTLSTRPAGWRVLDKGVEADLLTSFQQAGLERWRGVVTFYYRGRFTGGAAQGQELGAPSAAPVPEGECQVVDGWTTAATDRHGRFSRWTGDYNGIHRWRWYARMFGFRRAFAHPQSPALQCLARVGAADVPCRLDLWIKGPVSYGSQVELRRPAHRGGDAGAFWLHVDGDSRPALVGRVEAP